MFTRCPTPYDDAQELIRSVTDDRMLEVTSVAADPDRRHPLMDSAAGGAYDRFRAVHDVLGHARLGLGFDRNGEFAVWLSQEQFHSPLARRALATELHGQHSVRWTTGEVAEPKAVLLDPGLLSRTRAPGAPPWRRSQSPDHGWSSPMRQPLGGLPESPPLPSDRRYPTSRRNVLDGSVPWDWEKNGVKASSRLERPS